MTTGGVAVVGAGHGGAAVAAMLRQSGFEGPLDVFGDEVEFPYHRPPLSKRYADDDLEQLLRPADFYRDNGITLRRGTRVTAIDAAARTVRVGPNEVYGYDHVVLATGAKPRRIPVPGADLAGVLTLRTLEDARALRKNVQARRHLVVIGGGYLGLEVAAVARSNGATVAVVEREQNVLARVASRELARIVAAHHRRRGVVLHEGAQVEELIGDGGHVRGVVLADGRTLPCDVALVCIGAVPREELAVDAGLRCADGVVVDEGARTSAPGVLAVGDVTRCPLGAGEMRRLESIPSATEQARRAVATILGTAPPAPEIPWFWSDQYDLKIKIAGLVPEGAQAVLRGDPESGRFSVFHLLPEGAVAAVEAVNSSADFMAGKKLIAGGKAVDPDQLADSAVSLRDIVG